ncbi:serine/threonine-protein kinase [Nocardioides sp. YIM 152315]|uniref:serine/threonine-protein kinase n=1 Tax=Nocardioides sp. YIM 152315 TaxID=3031760 RepID=UPI0023DB7E8B|nr:serine/threonine-protein kinase [Nocardioides sp. YIM 152315]MDF1604481.1 serine/threonine protein kinase [Nocardioides sp. YIM 152315]
MTQTPGNGPGSGAGDGYADDSRRYRLDGRLATGGMGEVWRATDTVLDRPVAVKLLKAEYADHSSFRVRFETEAQHAASLHHANIATVYDFGESVMTDGSGTHRPFLVMELVDGQPLSALLRPDVPMDPIAVRELLAQAADGIGAAHAAGIVHRDVKPANLLVTPDRQVKVTDFGIARAAEGVGLTGTGEVMGTPQYLSPEQAQGQTATSASDVYSLGVVAFECLAGRRPFVGETAVATALAHLREPVPELPPSVPADLAAVVRRALAKDPAERFADGRALAYALRNPATEATRVVPAPAPAADASSTQVLAPVPVATTGGPAPQEERRRRSWVWPVVGVIALVAAVVLVVVLLTSGDGDEDPGDEQTTRATPTKATSEASEPSSPTSEAEDTTVRVDEQAYVGRPVGDVQRELADLGLRVVTEQVDNPGDRIEGDVTSVNPTGALEVGDTVTLGVWGPVPDEPTPSETASPTATESPTPSDTQSPADLQSPADTTSPNS